MWHDLPAWAYVVIALSLTHVTIAAVTIYLHRYQTHRALELHPLLSHFFRFWLWLTTGMVTREWVAIHRKHHANVETDDDPHSPQTRGIRKVLLEGAELYRAECKVTETVEQYGHQTPDDWLERHIYHGARDWGLVLMFLIDVGLLGAPGLVIWAVQMAWIPLFAAGVINGAGHYWGYRNYESADASTNIIPLGILIGGEELHNNHHAYASSARFSAKWYEFDLGWFYIRVLQALRLAVVRKLAPKLVIDRSKHGIDFETVRAVISNRLDVMSHYARDVVRSVCREESAKANRAARRFLRRGRRLLTRHDGLIDAHSRRHLEELLARHETLRVVYEFRQRLQDLWQQRSASHDSLVSALQEWCRAAEATGIHSLQEFSRALRGYTLAPARS